MNPSKRAILIDRTDNVATAISDIFCGDEVLIDGATGRLTIRAQDDIPFGHKIALVQIKKDDIVTKYGEPIGKATADINIGQWVHVHNVIGLRGRKVKHRGG